MGPFSKRCLGAGLILGIVGTTGPACSIFEGDWPGIDGPCGNHRRDQGEEGIDCGGSCAKCEGATCAEPADCASSSCVGGTCAPSASKTCGVGRPNACADGVACLQDLDCASDFCSDDASCEAAPPSVHTDGRRNGGETGADCGGSIAAETGCGGGQGCATSDDCLSTCNADRVCDAPGPTDGKKNADESDVDCGGAQAPKCGLGKSCTANTDCELLACTSGACVEPKADDGVQNGGESDVDCGGTGVSGGGVTYMAPRCADERKCTVPGDCTKGSACANGVCLPGSCATAETAGITTCGAREVGDPAATHETCCRSLALPTRKRRLDKYEITAGRFRTFLTAVGPNLRTWVQTYRTANPTSQLSGLPAAVVNIYPATASGSLGLASHMTGDIDNYGGFRGCWNGYTNDGNDDNDSYGHNTYWQDLPVLMEAGITSPRPLPRATTDAKSLNCAMPLMFFAFCAWDGGELAVAADYADVWKEAYPWGAAPVPETNKKPNSVNYNWCNGVPGTGGFDCQNTALGAGGAFYLFPTGTNLAHDMSPLISAPGRFPMDRSSRQSANQSWMDLFGNMVEYTGNLATGGAPTTFCDFSTAPGAGATPCTRANKDGTGTLHANIPRVGVVGRSWEGHVYDMTKTTDEFAVTFQYGKFGGRCARPLP